MTIPAPDSRWQDAQARVGLAELERMSSLTAAELQELVEYGALVPLVDEGGGPTQFSAGCIPPLREAARLRSDYDLDLFTVSLLLGYLHRIAQLEHQVRSLQAHPPHLPHVPRDGPAPWHEPHA